MARERGFVAFDHLDRGLVAGACTFANDCLVREEAANKSSLGSSQLGAFGVRLAVRKGNQFNGCLDPSCHDLGKMGPDLANDDFFVIFVSNGAESANLVGLAVGETIEDGLPVGKPGSFWECQGA